MYDTKEEMTYYAIWLDSANGQNSIESGLDAIWKNSLRSKHVKACAGKPKISYSPWLNIGQNFYLTRVVSSLSPGDICGYLKSAKFVEDDDIVMAIRVSKDYYIPNHGIASPQKKEALAEWIGYSELFNVCDKINPQEDVDMNHITVEKYLYDSGSVESESPYRNGKLHGINKRFYESGILKEETPFIDDLAHGVSKQYYESGILKCETPYNSGMTHGTHGNICPVTAALSTAGIIAASYYCVKAKEKPTVAAFGSITALIFASQMMNFPILNGTSGHLLGGILASSLLGIPFGVLALALVVTIQSLVFSDGGIVVLGANILNMAIIGAGVGGILYKMILAKRIETFDKAVAISMASWISIVLASLAASFELAIDGQIGFMLVMPAMVGVHALIGLGEAAITVVVISLLRSTMASTKGRANIVIPITLSVVIATILSPFASSFPDGLEFIAEKYKFLHESAPAFVGPLSDYTVPMVGNPSISTGIAGLIGVILAFSIAWIAMRILQLKMSRNEVS